MHFFLVAVVVITFSEDQGDQGFLSNLSASVPSSEDTFKVWIAGGVLAIFSAVETLRERWIKAAPQPQYFTHS